MRLFKIAIITAAFALSGSIGLAQQSQTSRPLATQQQIGQPVQQRALPGVQQAQSSSAAAGVAQAAEIEALIEQLVFAYPREAELKANPNLRNEDPEYDRQFKKCQAAFNKLIELKAAAFPQLTAHLNDARPSIPFRNHVLGCTVGDACQWNIHHQLEDRPSGYSRYGYSRIGRDGRDHPKPYWIGSPFDAAGGVKPWLEQHKHLSYPAMQIECLTWLLNAEKAIGVPDAESYFRDILPLEIRILERVAETGVDVQRELAWLRRVRDEKITTAVPAELLPAPPSASQTQRMTPGR